MSDPATPVQRSPVLFPSLLLGALCVLCGYLLPDSTTQQPSRPPLDSTFRTLTLAPGVTYQRLTTENHQIAHIVRIDLRSGARLRTFKARGTYDGLEDVRDIFYRARSIMTDTVLAASNASFWRANVNSPIGVTITDGVVIEMPGNKSWSTLMIHDDGTASIDRTTLTGTLLWKYRRLPIEGVNRRLRERGIIAYNRYYGTMLPGPADKDTDAILADAYWNRPRDESRDRTETELDTAEILRQYREVAGRDQRERSRLKIVCRPLVRGARPTVNDTMLMKITAIDTGYARIPDDGLVLSLGDASEWLTAASTGDTVRIVYSLAGARDPVRDAVTGTPRLVRDGHAAPEHEIEGSKAQRFVADELARTAVGISRGGDSLYLVAIDSPNPDEGRRGMSLTQIAEFMRAIGSHDAINLDGGGSTSMVIGSDIVSRQGWHPSTRNVTNAVIVVRPASH